MAGAYLKKFCPFFCYHLVISRLFVNMYFVDDNYFLSYYQTKFFIAL